MRTAALVGLSILSFCGGLGVGYAVWRGAEGLAPEGALTAVPRALPSREEVVAEPLQGRSPSRPAPGHSFVASVVAPSPAPVDTPCPECPECPPVPACGAPRDELLQALREDNARLRIRIADARERLRKTGPQRRYLEPTAQGRRRLAAEEDSLLLEVPSWKDDIALPDELGERLSFGAGERAEMEALYREFRRTLHGDLRALLSEMVGDPGAGENATIDSMIHDIIQLSPVEPCREQMRMITEALASGETLPPVGDGPGCASLILALFAAVDGLDAEVRGTLGDGAAEVLWGNTSTFEFGPLGGTGGAGLAP